MITFEEYFWYTISIIVVFFILYYLFSSCNVIEPFNSSYAKKDIIGKAKVIHTMSLHPIAPNIVPLRKHVHTWIVNVPLTPFRAPLLTLPPLAEGKNLPPFLLYKSQYISPVRNQGECGSCWAFAVTDMLSDRASIMSGGLFQYNLSVQQLLSCFATDGCDGGSPEEASFWLSKTKTQLLLDNSFKYDQSSGGAVTTACPRSKRSKYTVGIAPGEVYSIVEYIPETITDAERGILESNIRNMKMELYEGGPFYCAMTVYDDLFTYTGLKPYTPGKGSSVIGGHAVTIIGYCEAGEDQRKDFQDGYWICRNSWGKGWPTQVSEAGYFTVKMGSNVCGIESRCGFGTPQVFGDPYNGVPKRLSELRFESFKDYAA